MSNLISIVEHLTAGERIHFASLPREERRMLEKLAGDALMLRGQAGTDALARLKAELHARGFTVDDKGRITSRKHGSDDE